MHRKRHRQARRDVPNPVNENGAELLKPLDHMAVVDDLVADIERSPEFGQRLRYDVDRSFDTSAELSWRGLQWSSLGQRAGSFSSAWLPIHGPLGYSPAPFRHPVREVDPGAPNVKRRRANGHAGNCAKGTPRRGGGGRKVLLVVRMRRVETSAVL